MLTLEIAKIMKERSPIIVETATETFLGLDRIRELEKEKQKKELQANKKSLPNLIVGVLNLKKSRNNEKISTIASRCNYFLFSNEGTYSNNIPKRSIYYETIGSENTSKFKLNPIKAKVFDNNSARSAQRRLGNLTTLNKLDH